LRRSATGIQAAPSLNLPTDHPRPVRSSGRRLFLVHELLQARISGLEKLCMEQEVSLAFGLAALVGALLQRYCRIEAVPLALALPQFGLAGPLLLEVDSSADHGFRELLARLRQASLPFALRPRGSRRGEGPAAQVLVELLERPEVAPSAAAKLRGLNLGWELAFQGQRHPGGCALRIDADADLFSAERIERLAGHLTTLLDGVVADPEGPIGRLPILTPPEADQLARLSQGPRLSVPELCVHQLFEQQVERTPEAVALIFEEQALTYSELNARANRLVSLLIARGVGPEVIVALALERSIELVVALLAILKAGGAYLPLDPTLPPLRLAQILEDAAPAVVISAAGWEVPGGSDRSMPLLHLDDPALELDRQPAHLPSSSAASVDHLAYLTYTSGSTGVPKGVLIEHRGILRLLDRANPYAISSADRVLQLAPLAFDAATLEIWGPLLNGGTLVMAPPGQLSLQELAALLRRQRITTLWLTAGLFHAMVDAEPQALAGVRQILAGGDVLAAGAVQQLLDQLPAGHHLINGYGPTENTTFTCCHPLAAGDAVDPGGVPIGRPIAATLVRVLDRDGHPCPIGVPGELLIGGAGLARGYLNNPGLTAEKFIADPFAADPSARLYRSGDLVSWNGDGTLAFHGRIDQQIKLRGFRIEPGEIETHLLAHPAVAQAAVVLRSDDPANPRLIAYWVPQGATPSDPAPSEAASAAISATGAATAGQLRAFLAERLPDAMVPSAFVALEALPLTTNGKLDRSTLPAPSFAADLERRVVPSTERERQLHALWVEVLGHDGFGIEDNFFLVGGHSLAAARLVTQLAELTGHAVPITSLFQYPTIAALSTLLDNGPSDGTVPGDAAGHGTAQASALVRLQPHGQGPALFVVHGWGGDVFAHLKLAQAFAPHRRPVHGLQAIGFDGSQPRQSSVEAMAAHYADEIRRFQPEGPYHLLGFSAGAWYAWAVAAELCRQGAAIGLLGLIDPGPTSRVHKRLLLRHPPLLIRHWSSRLHLGGWWLRGALNAATRRAWGLLQSGGSPPPRHSLPEVAGSTAALIQTASEGAASDGTSPPAAPDVAPARRAGIAAAARLSTATAITTSTPRSAPPADRWRFFDYYVDRQNAYRPPRLPLQVHVFATAESTDRQASLWRFYSRPEPVIESFYDDHHDYLREGDAARRLALRLQGVMAEVEGGGAARHLDGQEAPQPGHASPLGRRSWRSPAAL
jgi:amino acid adenylation domain-containing protein